jgi:hypothetical protein
VACRFRLAEERDLRWPGLVVESVAANKVSDHGANPMHKPVLEVLYAQIKTQAPVYLAGFAG